MVDSSVENMADSHGNVVMLKWKSLLGGRVTGFRATNPSLFLETVHGI